MKILYLIKGDSDQTVEKFIDVHKANHEVKIINLDNSITPGEILDEIESSDKIISW